MSTPRSCACGVQVGAIHLLSKDNDNRWIRTCRSRELLGLNSSTSRSPRVWCCRRLRRLIAYLKVDWLLAGRPAACPREVDPICRMCLADRGQGVVGARRVRRNSKIRFPHTCTD